MAAGRQANGDVIIPGAWAYGESFSFLGTSGPGYSGGRASGGPVSGGSAYTVGERGPELFVPGSSGSIVPNGGGGMAITINITQPLGTPEVLGRVIGDVLTDRMRNLGMRL